MKTFCSFTVLLYCLILSACTDDESPIIPSYEGVVVNSLTNQPFEGITVSVTNGDNTKLSTTTEI